MKPSRGVLYMAASAFGFSVMGLLVKSVSPRLPTGELMFSRALVTLALSYVMVRRAGLSPWGHNVRALVFRGVLGFGGMTGYYVALARLPLGDTITLQNATPAITAWLAWLLLGERVGWSTGLGIVCSIAGVTIVVHPSGTGLDTIGVLASLGGTMCSSVAYVTVRKLAQTEDPLVIVFYFPLIATPLALPWMVTAFVWPQPIDWLLLIVVGVITQYSQVFLTRGLALERAGRASSISYLQVAFAMLWQLSVFGDPPTPWTIAGACMIVGGTLVVPQLTAEIARRLPQ